MDWNAFTAALFDLDGVLTPTAELHERAWREMFEAFLAGRAAAPYTDADYFAHIDGKPRYDGVRSLLESRGISLPDGDPSDPPSLTSVCGLGNRKNDVFNLVLARDGIAPYPGSLALVDALAGRGVKMAVVSSSKNAATVLAAAGIAGRFPVVVDGLRAAREGIAGKPAPDMFVRAAELLGVQVGGAVVIEDALSGVRAGAAGGFGLVVGVDRGAGPELLRAAGAQRIVQGLEELL